MGDLAALRGRLAELDRVVVAFSGGADSAFLAWVANDVLGRSRSLAVTAVSPSLLGEERDDCEALAGEWGLRWRGVETHELERGAYVANDGDRCYHCKAELMDVVAPLAAAEAATVVLGTNVDDLGDHRPGQRAASERGAAFPLVDAGFTKADVRATSKALGLRTWDKPAAACLASRVPYGTPVLDGAQRVRPDLPFACKGGVCGTCRARLTVGEVTMRRNYALEQEELDAGYVLTCQSLPASDQITVDYDA